MVDFDAAKNALDHGNKHPYDAPDIWWQGDDRSPPPAIDWAHRAARGVLSDLNDRRGIKEAFDGIDEDARRDISESLAAIIRKAHEFR